MASFSGTFSAVNQTSGILILQPQEVATITLTKTASNPWSVSLRQIIGGSAEVGLATYTTDQSATQYKNTTNSAQTLRLRCMVLTNTDTIAYAFADAPSSDVVFSWSDPEGNLLFSITEAGPVVPSNATFTASGPSTLTGTVTAGDAINMVKGADIASASTITLTTATGNWVDVTGTVAITTINLAAGIQRLVRFTGITTLVNGSRLVLPGSANITTAAGDYALFVGDSASTVRCVYYFRATGAPLVGSAASSLTGTTLASNVVNSSLTSVGTLSSLAVGGSGQAVLVSNASTGTTFQRFVTAGGDAYFGCEASDGSFFGAAAYASVWYTPSHPAYIFGPSSNKLVISATGTAITGAVNAVTVYSTTVGVTNRAVFVDSTGVLGYVASIRAAKTNIAPLENAAWIDGLNPVTFNYRAKDEHGAYTDTATAELQYGLIAEDVEKVNKELVFYDETTDGPALRGVSYEKLIIPLLKRVQELTARIAALEAAKV